MSMSLSRAWLSGCQPIARACISLHTLRNPQCLLLASRSCIQVQRQNYPQLNRDHRVSVTYSSFPSRILASASPSLEEQIQEKNKKHPVIVYSKSWCPYCGEVKRLFQELKVDFTAVELDQVDTLGAYSSGELAEKLSAAGVDAHF